MASLKDTLLAWYDAHLDDLDRGLDELMDQAREVYASVLATPIERRVAIKDMAYEMLYPLKTLKVDLLNPDDIAVARPDPAVTEWQMLALALYRECQGGRLEGDWERLMCEAKTLLTRDGLLKE